MEPKKHLEKVEADGVNGFETLEAGELPPPEPLTKTLELLEELPDDTALIQFNDRNPQHLYPKLDERGYSYDTVEEEDDKVTTVIWREG